MNKTTIKIFLSFSFVAAVIATLLLIINALGLGILASDTDFLLQEHSPKSILEDIARNLKETDTGYTLSNGTIPDDYWCILLDDNGTILWSENQPDDIPTHYSIRDIAKLTHWFCVIIRFLSAQKAMDFSFSAFRKMRSGNTN